MPNITIFIPKPSVTAQENISLFIDSTRPILEAYKNVASWDENTWDLAGNVAWRGRGKARITAVFSSHEASGCHGDAIISQPFLDFAKAYFLYSQGLRPTKAFFQRLAALRVLAHALESEKGSSKVGYVTPAVLNVADDLIKERFGAGAGYRVGRELTAIASFISEIRLVSVPFQWESGCVRPKEGNRTGVAADAKREQMLPSQAGLDALPQCFLLAENAPDIVTSSVAALLCTAPDRISEIFSLPYDCEVEQLINGKYAYGLRWWPGKGADPMVKWIAPTMVDVAKAAVLKLRNVSKPAREIAEWYEANPSKLFLKPELEHLRSNDIISLDDVESILGFQIVGSSRSWLKYNKIPINIVNKMDHVDYVKFADFERVIVAMLPKGFPIIDPKTNMLYSKALLVLRKNEMSPMRSTYACLVEPVGTTKINDGLGSGVKHGKSSMFSRMNFTEDDKSPIEIHSHQFRHWLNTLAQRGGLNQVEIAKWSGRINIRQNKVYDQMSCAELIEMTRDLMQNDLCLTGSLAELAQNAPVSRDEFMQLEFPTAHVTGIGFCLHDYTMLPCQRHGECVNCNEHICIKGDAKKLAQLKTQLELAEDQLRKAQGAIDDNYFGAERWYEHHLKTVIRLRELVRVHEDPNFPVGTVIILFNPEEYSPLLLAVQERLGPSIINTSVKLQKKLPTLSGSN